MGEWGWKATDGAVGGLRYEPGNWGDVLKLAWLLPTLEVMRDMGVAEAFDPFAGAPEYPLGGTVRRRLNRVSDTRCAALLEPYLARGVWPGSASVLADVLGGGMVPGGPDVCVAVYDADEGRRGALAGTGRFAMLPLASGYDVLPRMAEERAEGARGERFLLLDPYDFLAEWEDVLPRLLAVGAGVTVLLYVYNRSGRGSPDFRRYRSFRRALEAGGRQFCAGRVPADGFLPTTYHEMILLPSETLRGGGGYDTLCTELSERTHSLAKGIAEQGVFESG